MAKNARLDVAELRARLARHAPRVRSPGGGEVRRSAVAVVLREASADVEPDILLIRRAEREGDPWSGHMGLPGGRMDATDEDILATAIRETREEVGIDLARTATLLGQLDDLPAVARGKPVDLVITPFVFVLAVAADPELTVNDEVAEVLWAGLGPLARGERPTTMSYSYEGRRVDLPAHDVGGRIVWGLTYRILEMLFQFAGDAPGAVP